MDYAKLAYLKAEDLEARLQTNLAVNRVSKMSAARAELQAGIPQFLTALDGRGATGIFINLRLDSFGTAAPRAEIALLLDGKRAGTEEISASVSFMASADLDGVIEISLNSDVSVALIKADIMLIGDAGFCGGSPLFKIDCSDNLIGAVKIDAGKGGGIRFFEIIDLENPVLDGGFFLGSGDEADVCRSIYGSQNAWFVVHKDTENNVFLSVIRKDGGGYKHIKCAFLAGGVDSVALLSCPDTVVFGYTAGGGAYVGTVTPDLILENVVKIDSAERIDFVKNSYPPIAMVCSKEKNVLRVSENELNSRDCIRLELSENIV